MNEQAPGLIWVVARVHKPDEGGVQTYVAEVAQAYARMGLRVTVFAKSSAGPRRVEDGAVTLVDVGAASQLQVYLRLGRAMAGAWRAGERPQMIHACTWRAGLPALLFPRPLLVTVHGREIGRPSGTAYRLMRAVLARAARIVAVSEATRGLMLARMPSIARRCITAWNGSSDVPDQPAGIDSDVPRVVTVCRLVPRKNVPAAVKASLQCFAEGIPLHHAVIGRGPDEHAVRRLVEEHDAEHEGASGKAPVELTGYVSDEELAARYRTADIFLHPQVALEGGAEIEGFGLVIADAMARGIPCIVGRDGGPGELVRHGIDGMVVDGNSPDAIAQALARLASDADLRRRMGASARAFAAENFSWDRHCRLATDGLLAPQEAVPEGRPAASASG